MFYLLLGPECWRESVTTYSCPQLTFQKQLLKIKYSGCKRLARGILGKHLCQGRDQKRRKDEYLGEVNLWF